MQEYDMLIDRDWLYQVNPNVQWNTHIDTTEKPAQQRSKSIIPHTFPRLPIAKRLTFFSFLLLKEPSDEMISSKYCDYADIFSATKASKLPNTQGTHDIDLFLDKKPPWKPIYLMLAIELETFKLPP